MEAADSRILWEQIFREDSESFLNYYYHIKVPANWIQTDQEPGQLVSMIHWNPYRLHVRNRLMDTRYLIAVATKPEYRHQGRMAHLLKDGLRQFAGTGMPFAWLMPADPKIYEPFDFRYIYEKREGILPKEERFEAVSIQVCPLAKEDYEPVCAFLERELSARYEVYAERTPAYLKMMQAEVDSEGGGQAVIVRGREIAGYFSWWGSEQIEIRELVCLDTVTGEIPAAVSAYFGEDTREIKGITTGWLGEPKPIIMARIASLKDLVTVIRSRLPVTFTLKVEDPIIPENDGIFRWSLTAGTSVLERADVEEPDFSVAISTFTEWIFGVASIPGWEDILPLKGVFLNEIV